MAVTGALDEASVLDMQIQVEEVAGDVEEIAEDSDDDAKIGSVLAWNDEVAAATVGQEVDSP